MTPTSPVNPAPCASGDSFESAAEALGDLELLHHPRLRDAAALLDSGRFGPAAKTLQEFLKTRPRDASALHILAEIALRQGRIQDAEALSAQSVALAPELAAARFGYANALLLAGKPAAALIEADILLMTQAQNPLFRRLKAMALEGVEDNAAAAAIWRDLTEDFPTRSDIWLRYGHVLRGMGARDECVAAYRKVIALDSAQGEAWWGLADLKTFRFSDAEIEQMEIQLARADLSADSRTRLHFALGKAYADGALPQKAFSNYARGNALYRLGIEHDPGMFTAYVARCKRIFTEEFFRSRTGSGCQNADPIFLVGMPRAGSTLVEQILASHSQVEGTRELSDLTMIANLRGYPENLETIDAAELKAMGEQYVASTRVHRKLGRPFFTDKMGPNFVYTGLLHLILPNARIVDVRRHPLACGFSIFTQIFPKGQNDAYRLADIGHLYRAYVELMAHFDRVLPGKVHRVFYESLVADPEREIRSLLGYLGLPFEEACLEFHKTDRVVTTVSSEQVRHPLYRDALEQWRPYEPWLGPLKGVLGSALDAYPEVPSFD